MKKLILVSIIIILVGCSKEENPTILPVQVEESIYGKWFYKEIIVNNITIPYDDHEPCGKDYIEFYEENKIRGVDIWDCQQDIDWIGTFLKTNTNLTIYNGGQSRTVEIVELNTNSLIYKYDYDDNNDGINEKYIEKFTRQ